jgi:hypothetical protein
MSNINFIKTPQSLNIVFTRTGQHKNVSVSDPLYADVLEAIKSGADEDTVLAIFERAAAAVKAATQITPRISIAHGVVTFDGQALDNSLTQRMLQMLDEGFDLVPMGKFLENLMANPSFRAVQELYSFLEKGKMPITPDGHFMAYKAVRVDFKDIHSGTMDNSVGRVVSMPRNAVDDDKNRTCSSGLHFCSFDYLPHFANANGHVMLVKINPADVVSIPADYNDTKGRACRYEVVGEHEGYYKNEGPLFKSSVYDPETGNQTGSWGARDEEAKVQFEVYADDAWLDTFDTQAEALDYINDNLRDARIFEIREEDGNVVATIEGEMAEYTIYVDGDEHDTAENMDEARNKAVQLFMANPGSDVEVKDSDEDVVMELRG